VVYAPIVLATACNSGIVYPSPLLCDAILAICCSNVHYPNPLNPKYFSELLSTQVQTKYCFIRNLALQSHFSHTQHTPRNPFSLNFLHGKTQHLKIAAFPPSRAYGAWTRPRLFSIADTPSIVLPFSRLFGRSRKMATATTSKPNKLHGRAFYESIGSPKMVVAPMVDRSEFVSTRILPSRTQYLTNTTGLEGAYQIIYG
jgi:hypothetical protein